MIKTAQLKLKSDTTKILIPKWYNYCNNSTSNSMYFEGFCLVQPTRNVSWKYLSQFKCLMRNPPQSAVLVQFTRSLWCADVHNCSQQWTGKGLVDGCHRWRLECRIAAYCLRSRNYVPLYREMEPYHYYHHHHNFYRFPVPYTCLFS